MRLRAGVLDHERARAHLTGFDVDEVQHRRHDDDLGRNTGPRTTAVADAPLLSKNAIAA